MMKEQIVASIEKTLQINRGFADLDNGSLALLVVEQLESEGCFADEVDYDAAALERELDYEEFTEVVRDIGVPVKVRIQRRNRYGR